MARSTTLPLTIKAWELGKSLLIVGGLPISRAFLKPAGEAFALAMTLSPFVVTRIDDSSSGSSNLKPEISA
jgi:hypothetical protein